MLYWFSISLIVFSLAFAETPEEKEYIEKNQSKIESVKNKYEGLKMPANVEKYKELEKNKADVEKYKELGNVNVKELEGLFRKNWLDYNIELKSDMTDKKKNLIFYLFSTSVPSQTVKNVFLSSKKYKNLEFYGVVRGISKKTWDYLQSLDDAMNDMIIKINPNIFRLSEIKLVPAFVLAECNDRPMGIIRSSSCSFKAVIYGDVSLDFAIEKFKERGLWKE